MPARRLATHMVAGGVEVEARAPSESKGPFLMRYQVSGIRYQVLNQTYIMLLSIFK